MIVHDGLEVIDRLFDEVKLVAHAVYNELIVKGKPAAQTLKSYLLRMKCQQ